MGGPVGERRVDVEPVEQPVDEGGGERVTPADAVEDLEAVSSRDPVRKLPTTQPARRTAAQMHPVEHEDR
jgi:hypothetical protein